MKRVKLISLIFLVQILGILNVCTGQNATLLNNVVPLSIQSFVELNNKTVFSGTTGLSGRELWITDGTVAGTNLIKDINPGSAIGIRSNFTIENNGFLYFGAEDPINGIELWKTDGTDAGTTLIKDINPGVGNSAPDRFVVHNNLVFFSAFDGTANSLWVTNGTNSGTTKIKDFPGLFTLVGISFDGFLYFTGRDLVNGTELWKTDGTPGGTQLVADINPGINDSGPQQYFVFQGNLYFVAFDDINGTEIRKQGPQNSTPQLLKNIKPGNDLVTRPYMFTVFNGFMYFSADDGVTGFELWRTDGTTLGTTLFKDISTSSVNISSSPALFTVVNNKMFFNAFTDANGFELWATDGTVTGTNLFSDLNPTGSSIPDNFLECGDNLYFVATDGNGNTNLFEVNEDSNNPIIITTASPTNPSPFSLQQFGFIAKGNGKVYMRANFTLQGQQLYVYNPESAIIWTGSSSTNWNSPLNWLPQQIPTDTNNVLIPASCPRYPIIKGTDNVSCKKLQIKSGATIRMNAGILNIYGKVTAADANVFDLFGGGVHLYHGSVFPDDMSFNNLVITNENDIASDNTYEFPGTMSVFGSMKINGTSTNPDIPLIRMLEGDVIQLAKDFTINKGTIGWDIQQIAPVDRTLLPTLHFVGSQKQNIAVNNTDNSFNPGMLCNLIFDNDKVEFTNGNVTPLIFNLTLNQNFNLAGKKLVLYGKIIYADGVGNSIRITNSVPSKGKLRIFNLDDIVIRDSRTQIIKVDKLESLSANLNFALDTVLLASPLATDSISAFGFLDLFGQNLTIGSTSSNHGYMLVDSIGTSIASGTLALYGNSSTPRYNLVAKDLNNLVVNSPSGVELNNAINLSAASSSFGRMNLYGTAKLTSGNFDLKGSFIELVKAPQTNLTNKAKLIETPGNTFVNSVVFSTKPGIGIDTNVTTAVNSKNFGGLGLVVTCSNPLNQLGIIRVPESQTGINGGSTINRVFIVSNPGGSIGLNATLRFEYDESELLGVNESDLALYRRSNTDPAGTWTLVPSAVNFITNVASTIGGLSQLDISPPGSLNFTEYTLASVSDPLKKGNEGLDGESVHVSSSSIYPNPFKNEFRVSFFVHKSEFVEVQIVDVTGKLQHTIRTETTEGFNTFEICCLDNLASGIYFIRIASTEGVMIRKMFKE